jgi:hypothetical protein
MASESLDARMRGMREPGALLALAVESIISVSLEAFANAVEAVLRRRTQAT